MSSPLGFKSMINIYNIRQNKCKAQQEKLYQVTYVVELHREGSARSLWSRLVYTKQIIESQNKVYIDRDTLFG